MHRATRWAQLAAEREVGGRQSGSGLLMSLPQGGEALVVNQEEAQRVRGEIFALYLEFGSLIPVVEELDRRGWRMKSWTTRAGRQAGGKPIPKNSLYNLLTNMIYTGKVEYGGQVYNGEHERIIDDQTWNRVQSVLNRNGRRGGRNVGNKHGALLKGLVRCGACDVGMIHTYVKKKNCLYRYYVCVKAHQRGWTQCDTRSVSAPAIENAVVEQLRGIGRNPAMLRAVLGQIEEHRLRKMSGIDREKRDIELEMKKIAQEMGGMASMAGGVQFATDRLAELQDGVTTWSTAAWRGLGSNRQRWRKHPRRDQGASRRRTA